MNRKKNFSGGINSLLEGTVQNRSSETPHEHHPAAKQRKSSKGKTTIASFVMHPDTLETMRALAYWERKKIKDILEESMQLLISGKGVAYIEKALEEYRNSCAKEQ